MRKTLLAAACGVALLSGCANDNYRMYADAQKAMVNAEAMKEAARYQALTEIAKQGDTAAKVAAVMSIQFNGGGAQRQPQIAPPVDASETALRWASVLVPGFTQFYTINQNSKVAMTQSNNATALGLRQSDNQANVAMNTNAAFTTMNSNGLTTAGAIATTGFAATTAVSNTGMASIVNVANTGSNNLTTLGTAFSNASVSMTNASANAISNLANTIPQLQPNITTTSTSTSTSTTTNSCGSGTSGGTLTCP